MLFNLTVNDARNVVRGSTRLELDWATNQWAIQQGQQQAWSGVGLAKGTFELKDRGVNSVIWLWDQPPGKPKRNTVIIWNPPVSGSDSKHLAGQARIFEPADPAFREGRINWMVDAAAKPATEPELAPIRQEVIRLCNAILPLPIGTFLTPQKSPMTLISLEYRDRPDIDAMYKAGRSYTNCGAFPAYIAKKLNGKGLITKGLFDQLPAYAKRQDIKAWVPAEGGGRPLPGDFYALEKSKGGKMSHVGVIIKAEGDNWITADSGQGVQPMKDAGFAAGFRNRKYVNDGSLEGETAGGQGGGFGYLSGWVNIDNPNLFPDWAKKR